MFFSSIDIKYPCLIIITLYNCFMTELWLHDIVSRLGLKPPPGMWASSGRISKSCLSHDMFSRHLFTWGSYWHFPTAPAQRVQDKRKSKGHPDNMSRLEKYMAWCSLSLSVSALWINNHLKFSRFHEKSSRKKWSKKHEINHILRLPLWLRSQKDTDKKQDIISKINRGVVRARKSERTRENRRNSR